MARTHTFYCYQPHRAAVIAALDCLFNTAVTVRGVRSGNVSEIRGLECGTWIDIASHPVRPPRHLLRHLRVYGWTVWRIHDQWTRDRRGKL